MFLRFMLFDVMTILGCDITFYAVIPIDHRFRLVTLTPTFSCIQSASDGRDRMFLYSAFTAASVLQAHILQDATRLLNNPPAMVIPANARQFPAVSKLRKYPPSSDDYFAFEIRCFFPDKQLNRLLYIAEMPAADKQLVLIKFARQYSIELHELCANSGHAPRILAFERLPGGWFAVAMEYIESGVPITHSSLLPAHRDRWMAELRGLMHSFHEKGFVHGDLRDANIICKNDSVMLIDFDWGGKEGEVFYPTSNLNDELLQGRVSGDLRITKEDDRRVLTNTLARLQDIHG
jgi:serine/threonine protein kinase